MKKMKSSTLVLALAALATTPAAFAAGETIAVFTKNQTNPFFQAVRLGADSAAKQLNAKVTHYVPTKPDSIPEQMSQVEDVIVKKPAAIVFTPVDYKAMAPAVAKINNARIPVVNITDKSETGQFVSFVGASDYSLAHATATHLYKSLGGKGNVVVLEGVKGSLTSVERVRGFTEAAKAFPGVKVLAAQPANYQRLQALQVMENLMQSFPQIDGILAANDAMAAGAVEALEGANRKAQVVGINGTKEAIDAIKAGKMLATGDYNGFLQGCVGTMAAVRKLRNQPVPAEVLFKPTVIDKSNLQAWDNPVESRSCPSWDEATRK
jgi:ribose transport system substrate-binding protein